MESSPASCAHSHFNQRRAVRVVPYSLLPIKQCPLVITGTDVIAGDRGLAGQGNCGAPGGGSPASRTLAQALFLNQGKGSGNQLSKSHWRSAPKLRIITGFAYQVNGLARG